MRSTDHTLFLLDGMALAYRAHFALATNPIRTSSGRVTSGIYGFTNTLLDLLNRFNPTHLAVVFDTDAPTARHKEFEAYKAQRNAMPEELSQALPDIKRMIRAFNFPVLELDGYEADDLIATLARKAEPAGFTTYMVDARQGFRPARHRAHFAIPPLAHGRQSRDARPSPKCSRNGASRRSTRCATSSALPATPRTTSRRPRRGT